MKLTMKTLVLICTLFILLFSVLAIASEDGEDLLYRLFNGETEDLPHQEEIKEIQEQDPYTQLLEAARKHAEKEDQ